MDREAIKALLDQNLIELLHFLKDQDNDKWESGPKGKWTTGQQALHLLQSIKPLNTALSLPKFILKSRFGKCNREIRSYDEVVKRYHQRLEDAKGITYGPSKNMKIPPLTDKKYLIDRLQTEYRKLEYKTEKKWSDKALDNLVLPHPLMGKMPVRELLMWTAYHTEHHTNTLKAHYS